MKKHTLLISTSFAIFSLIFLPLSFVHATGSGFLANDVLGQTDFTGNGGNAPSGDTNQLGVAGPTSLAVDSINHRLFVSDTSNNRILEYNLDSSNNIISHTPNHVLGQTDFTGNGTGLSQNSLNCTGKDALACYNMAFDPINDYLFVSDTDNNRVLVFDLSHGITDGMNASHVLGASDFNTNTGGLTTQSDVSAPGGLTYDKINKRLFVADQNNIRVLVFDLSHGITDGMNASHVLGASDFNTNTGGLTTQSGMDPPIDLAYDEVNQRLFVDDGYNSRILIFDLANGITDGMNASHVLGASDFNTPGSSAATQNDVDQAFGLSFDPINNRIFVDDAGNNRILIFDLANGITDNMNAAAVLGQPDFTSSDPGTSQNAMSRPFASAYDSTNNRLYIADAFNNRILIYNLLKITTTSLTQATIGVTYHQQITVANSQGTVTYRITKGALPAGLSLDANTGIISGSPTTAGRYMFEVSAYDDNGDVGVIFDDPTYTIVVSGLPGAPNTGYGQANHLTLMVAGLLSVSTIFTVLGIRTYKKNNI